LYFNKNIQLVHNKANRVGGAIVCIDSYLLSENILDDKIEISYNEASRGSAIYLSKLFNEFNLFNSKILLSYNTAIIGGTIYWIYDYDDDYKNIPPNIAHIKFINNSALYGKEIATQAITINGPKNHIVTSYIQENNDHNPILFKAYDFYNQSLFTVASNSYIFSATINPKSPYTCRGRPPSVSR